jgi:hypothetical protein
MQAGRFTNRFSIKGKLIAEPRVYAPDDRKNDDDRVYYFTVAENYSVRKSDDSFEKRSHIFDLSTTDKNLYNKLVRCGVGSLLEVHGAINTYSVEGSTGKINPATNKPYSETRLRLSVSSVQVISDRQFENKMLDDRIKKALEAAGVTHEQAVSSALQSGAQDAHDYADVDDDIPF